MNIMKDVHGRTFEQAMENKQRQLLEIEEKWKNKELLEHRDFSFLTNEIGFLFDDTLSKSIFYLEGHASRVKEKFMTTNGIQAIQKVVAVYFSFEEFLMEKKLGIFGRKKVIDSCIERAKEVLKETEDDVQIVKSFIKQRHDFIEKWEDEKRTWERFSHQLTINRPFLPKEIDWMIRQARYSLNEQIHSGQLYFLNPLERLEIEKREKQRAEDYIKVFSFFKKAIQTIATEPIPLLDTGQHLERMKNHVRQAIEHCKGSYHRVRNELKTE